ncbi:MAG: hypothetical protein GQ529_08705 [Methyloprofundus sp.]|nr:hypothetical protein [Methyloprofundus sp.]
MFEILLIILVIYVAYLIYSTEDDNEQTDKPAKVDVASTDKPVVDELKTKVATKTPVKPKKAVAKVKSETAKTEPKKAAKSKVNKTAAPKIELRTVEMKNPKTGEQAKVANNYRMVKRWIKEALVEEGLLEKIYKTNEMDDAAKAEVAKALSIIKAMDKYKV